MFLARVQDQRRYLRALLKSILWHIYGFVADILQFKLPFLSLVFSLQLLSAPLSFGLCTPGLVIQGHNILQKSTNIINVPPSCLLLALRMGQTTCCLTGTTVELKHVNSMMLLQHRNF
jgi:hypothetical protein